MKLEELDTLRIHLTNITEEIDIVLDMSDTPPEADRQLHSTYRDARKALDIVNSAIHTHKGE